MAIPVANPPPRYEPGAAPPPASDPGARRDPPFGSRGRGCLTLVGIAGVIGCIASIGLAVSCHSVVQIGEREAVRRIAASYRAAAVQNNESAADEPDLSELEQLGDRGDISIVAFGILNNRWNDAFANDGAIDASELHFGMQLVHDIVASHGNVDIQRYPDGR